MTLVFQRVLLLLLARRSLPQALRSLPSTARTSCLAPRQAGFTLIELLVVLFILGLAMAVIIPNFEGFSRKGEENQALNRLRQVLSQSRLLAIRQQKIVWLRAVTNDDRVSIAGPSTSVLMPEFSRLECGSKKLSQVNIGFFPNGASSGTDCKLLFKSGKAYRFSVSPVTGEVSIEAS